MQQERALRRDLEGECKHARDALTQRIAQEKAAAQKAQLLADELDKQRVEQQLVDGDLQQQVGCCNSTNSQLMEICSNVRL